MLLRVESIFCVVVVFMVMVVMVVPRQCRVLFHNARIILEKEAFIDPASNQSKIGHYDPILTLFWAILAILAILANSTI